MIKANSSEAYNLLHQGILALSRAEQQGMRIDTEYCERKSAHITRKIEFYEKRFRESKLYRRWSHSIQGVPNVNSDPQLRKVLYEVMKLTPPKLTDKGHGSTDEDSLKQLNIPELNDLLTARGLRKVRDTYLGAFVREQVNGVIHPFYNLHTVRTFRSSSDSPNFQNIPKRDKEVMKVVRRAIYPRQGHMLMEVDYSGIEVRIAACYHFDPTMIKYIKDKTTDMHGDMAQQIFVVKDFNKDVPEHELLRGAAKNGFVFPQFYGDYYKNCAVNMACGWGKLPEGGRWKPGAGVPMPGGIHLSDHLIGAGLTSLDKFTTHIQKIEEHFWNTRFPVYQRWKIDWWKQYQRQGYVDMYTGFRCSGLMGRNDAINYPIQGSAFHCLLWSFNRLDSVIRREQLKTRLLGQIHDAIILDIYPPELDYIAALVKRITCEELPQAWKWINVPLEIEAELAGVDESWADLKKFKLP